MYDTCTIKQRISCLIYTFSTSIISIISRKMCLNWMWLNVAKELSKLSWTYFFKKIFLIWIISNHEYVTCGFDFLLSNWLILKIQICLLKHVLLNYDRNITNKAYAQNSQNMKSLTGKIILLLAIISKNCLNSAINVLKRTQGPLV